MTHLFISGLHSCDSSLQLMLLFSFHRLLITNGIYRNCRLFSALIRQILHKFWWPREHYIYLFKHSSLMYSLQSSPSTSPRPGNTSLLSSWSPATGAPHLPHSPKHTHAYTPHLYRLHTSWHVQHPVQKDKSCAGHTHAYIKKCCPSWALHQYTLIRFQPLASTLSFPLFCVKQRNASQSLLPVCSAAQSKTGNAQSQVHKGY